MDGFPEATPGWRLMEAQWHSPPEIKTWLRCQVREDTITTIWITSKTSQTEEIISMSQLDNKCDSRQTRACKPLTLSQLATSWEFWVKILSGLRIQMRWEQEIITWGSKLFSIEGGEIRILQLQQSWWRHDPREILCRQKWVSCPWDSGDPRTGSVWLINVILTLLVN